MIIKTKKFKPDCPDLQLGDIYNKLKFIVAVYTEYNDLM